MKITLSKNQWEEMGRKAGWVKKSIKDMQEMYVSFSKDYLFDGIQDIKHSDQSSEYTDIWIVGYNSSAINDDQLFNSMMDSYNKKEYGEKDSFQTNFYKQYFQPYRGILSL